ncbi:MAG TPA: hypothetical protein VGV87_23020 [Blastocatellia bacterium]|jgi:hypothetical protein|nr:hypothetical protein [Blastocatellia bacterium]
MKRILLAVHVITLAFAFALTTFVLEAGVKAGKPASDVAVTTTIDGLGLDTLPTLRIQSDQLGAYPNSSSLKSILQGPLGDWELDTLGYNSSPQRKVLIDFRNPVTGTGPNGGAPAAPFASGLVRARFIAKCSQYGTDMRNMQPNNFYPCPLAIAFDDPSGVRYRLTMHANHFPEVNLMQVTCVTTASKCNQWLMEPSVTQLDGERKNVTKLLKVATKPNQPDQDMGDFYMSFTIRITNP